MARFTTKRKDGKDKDKDKKKYRPPAGAECSRGGDEFRVLQRKNLTPDDTTEAEPAGHSEKENQRADREVRPRYQNAEHEQEARYRQARIEHAHHDGIHDSTGVAGDGAVGDADGKTDQSGEDANRQG